MSLPKEKTTSRMEITKDVKMTPKNEDPKNEDNFKQGLVIDHIRFKVSKTALRLDQLNTIHEYLLPKTDFFHPIIILPKLFNVF